MSYIQQQIEVARQKLLDLTMRNRLLNFKPSKLRTLRIVDEIPREIYDILVLKEKAMSFLPVPEKKEISGKNNEGFIDEREPNLSSEEFSVLWSFPKPEAGIADRHTDLFLQTDLKSETLQKKLFYINQEAHSIFEEQGYTVLFLALGFLEWTESSQSINFRRAPILLIPVELERAKVRSSFKVKWTGEDVFMNISLQAKLVEQGISLPEFDMTDTKEGIENYFRAFNKSISCKREWKILSENYLDFFSFTKFVMFKDLSPDEWPDDISPENHPLIQAIFNPSPIDNMREEIQEKYLGKKLSFRNLYHIMDADPSQMAVIEEVKNGNNLVVEGPPGTGKSQTITNMIAELLAAGKSVLFVSEKMAALEVVKNRLDKVGLGDFCLELHSRKSSKKQVLQELERTINSNPPKNISLEEEFEQLENLKSELDGYAESLRDPLEEYERNPYDLFSMKEKACCYFEKLDKDMPKINYSPLEQCAHREWIKAVSSINNISEIIPFVKPISQNPWKGCETEIILPADEVEIEDLIKASKDKLNNLLEKINNLFKVTSFELPAETIQDIEIFTEFYNLSSKFFLFRIFNARYRQLKNKILKCEKINIKEVKKILKELIESEKSFILQIDILKNKLNINYENIFGLQIDKVNLKKILSKFDTWKGEVFKLQKWAQFVSLRKECINTIAGPIIKVIEDDLLEKEDLLPCFEGNFADFALKKAFSKRKELSDFMGYIHENKINRFKELDSKLIFKNRQRLAAKLYQNRPYIFSGASSGSEAGILLGEFNRKRKHLPIRKLMSLAGGLIQKIKPCFMMSPLSIAQFLDPRTVTFDAIIFDEASQVKPEDALGALLRGKQVVVLGDTRQLPPTSFFSNIIDKEEDYEEDSSVSLGDIESILHQCKRSFPTRPLKWHYRSKHESLIAVSNQEFYNNRLLIYPSPTYKSKKIGLHFIHIPDTIYDRGKSSVNRQEAKVVAKATLDHYKEFPDKSLGIGTFNIKQQNAILEEIELQLRLNSAGLEEYFSPNRDEHFFVKNLETIQGDERDVIFISVGFGFDANKTLSLNFGPLNQEGGERRLNVLITRAREKCVVFANFQAKDLKIQENSPFGLRALKFFLDYAENRKFIAIEETGRDSDSPFEDSIYEFLRNNNYVVRKQIGCAGFRVDLAIIDPQNPGRYLLGIECDGAKYHSSSFARERDRLRQQILEGLGWTIYRVWSTDWYRNRIESGKKLIEAIEEVKKNKNEIPDKLLEYIQKKNNIEEYKIEREIICTPNRQENIRDLVSEYKKCEFLNISSYYCSVELHKVPENILETIVIHIVSIEGPIHTNELIQRIRFFWGVKKAGKRIQAVIERAVWSCGRKGLLHISGEFIYDRNKKIEVRRRIDVPLPKIDLICDEEIEEAIKIILKNQFDTFPEELVTQTARLLGYQSTSKGISDRINEVLNDLIEQGELIEKTNSLIHLQGYE